MSDEEPPEGAGDVPVTDPEPLRRSGLTREALDALLERLAPGDRKRAGVLYTKVQERLVRMFEWHGCEDPKDLADQTLDRVSRRLAEGTEVESIEGFISGVARRLCKEAWRKQMRKPSPPEGELQPHWPLDPQEDARLACMRRCLARLPEDQRRLILRYHGEDDRIRVRRELAREMGIEMNALRIRAHRLSRTLAACVRQCLREGG